ncbi:Panacea domain-containing protein [Mycolicibacterium septicum]|uniref:Panacea domain-containing protein n=1 Tax=Mycolicibacterium septicum TaxID=98668 RepID=A0ABW9LW91_9MYCO
MVSVHDVAAYILEKRGAMSTMKLQKLCYYSQGWSLAWDEKPLFDEPIRAWANGPVVYELFDEHRGQFRVRQWPTGDSDKLSQDERETVDAVLFAYGKLTGQQLSDKSHTERPWVEARAGLPAGTLSSAVIELETMQDFFGALAVKEADALDEAEFDDEPLVDW